jgi:hypothetical protein
MCSQIVDEPGPPFQKNVTGRVRGSLPSSVYATVKTRAISSPSAFRIGIVPARAVYASGFPPTVTVWCVTDGAGSAAAAGRAVATTAHASSGASTNAANLRIVTERRVRCPRPRSRAGRLSGHDQDAAWASTA